MTIEEVARKAGMLRGDTTITVQGIADHIDRLNDEIDSLQQDLIELENYEDNIDNFTDSEIAKEFFNRNMGRDISLADQIKIDEFFDNFDNCSVILNK